MSQAATVARRTDNSHLARLPNFRISREREWFLAILILLVAGAWRFALAVQMPVISRDGVVFCWYARSLGEQGVAYLRSPDAQQHPLFPALLLAGQRAALACGAPDGPLTWQIVGQSTCCIAGLGVVLLVGSIAVRLAILLELPIDERSARLTAMALAALIDLNLWLSADVMSDQLHLAFYLAAIRLALPSWSAWRLALAGVLAGLAFLTRQEGFMPAVAALIALVLAGKAAGWRRTLVGGSAVLVAFIAVAGPYWFVVGRFSTKKDPGRWFAEESVLLNRAADGALVDVSPTLTSRFARAKLETIDLSWYAALPQVVYRTFHAGRVIVPLLALLPLIHLRNRWLDPRLAPVLACIGGHVAMVTLLLDRYGYLATRHLLVVVVLLMPFAAMFVARVVEIAVLRRAWLLGVVTAVAALGPLLPYAFRVPNGHERYLRDAAAWLADRTDSESAFVSGSSGRRIAFYAGTRWQQWNETPEDAAGAIALLRQSGSGFFALETGPGFERRGNDALLSQLPDQAAPGLELREAQRFDANEGATLHLLRFVAER